MGVRVKPHPQFRRDGTTVLYEQPVTFFQAAMGAELEIPTIDGKVKYTLPAGTQTGTTFRLRADQGRGDQYVTIRVQVPTSMNAEQKEALRAFAQAMGGECAGRERPEGLFLISTRRKNKVWPSAGHLKAPFSRRVWTAGRALFVIMNIF